MVAANHEWTDAAPHFFASLFALPVQVPMAVAAAMDAAAKLPTTSNANCHAVPPLTLLAARLKLGRRLEARHRLLIVGQLVIRRGGPAVPAGEVRLDLDTPVAVDETVIPLHPPLPLVGVSIVMERGCQQNDSLVRG